MFTAALVCYRALPTGAPAQRTPSTPIAYVAGGAGGGVIDVL